MSTVPRNRHHRSHLGSDFIVHREFGGIQDGYLTDLHDRLLESDGHSERVEHVMEDLFLSLKERRYQSTPEEWKSLIQQYRAHPLCALVHQDPFTYRAFSKPRGYAGDAVMMDYIYGREECWPTPPATPLGQQIFDYTTRAPASEGVRARRGFIADLLDNLAAEHSGAHVLSIASGHLREASLAAAVRRRRFGRFVALDADSTSLEEVKKSYGPFGIETVAARVGRLIDTRLGLGQFDLIYSLGLFDYVPQRLGQRIVSRLFDMLRPGGCVVVANFLPHIRDIGYMETFMDWQLIYRTRHEMIGLIEEIPQSKIKTVKLVAEENQNIIFVMVTRD